MVGAAAQAVQGFLQEPIFIGFDVGIATWWMNDGSFIWRKMTLTEGIVTISLLENTPAFNSETGEESEGLRLEDGGKALRLSPIAVFMVTKDDNT